MFRNRRPRSSAAGWGRLVPPLPRRAIAATVVVISVLVVVTWLAQPRSSAPGSPSRDRVAALLDTVEVVSAREPVPGYDRECSGASACVFGPAWSDATGAPGAGNGCSTRHDVLSRDLTGAVIRSATGCEVSAGILVDPYTGRVVDVAATGIRGIHVDHVFPLAAAWDLGAWGWNPARRATFANDVDRNLIAVTGSVNSGKSDATPQDWMPPDVARHCFYASRYLTAAVAYGLPVTTADHEILREAVRRCPTDS